MTQRHHTRHDVPCHDSDAPHNQRDTAPTNPPGAAPPDTPKTIAKAKRHQTHPKRRAPYKSLRHSTARHTQQDTSPWHSDTAQHPNHVLPANPDGARRAQQNTPPTNPHATATPEEEEEKRPDPRKSQWHGASHTRERFATVVANTVRAPDPHSLAKRLRYAATHSEPGTRQNLPKAL